MVLSQLSPNSRRSPKPLSPVTRQTPLGSEVKDSARNGAAQAFSQRDRFETAPKTFESLSARGAFVGSGSAITRSLPADSLTEPESQTGTTSTPPPLPPPAAKKKGFFGKVGNFFSNAGRRIGDAARSLGTGAVQTIVGAVRNIGEGLGRAGRGLGKIFQGKIGAGFKDLFLGLLDATVGTAADAILMVLGKTVSAIQTLIGVEPPGRKLTAEEMEAAKEVFGDSVDLSKVRVKEGDAGLFSLGGAAAFVHGNTIYVAADNASQSLIIHEMTHVWQHQNGGTDYMREALISQNWGKGYDWEQSVPGTAWADLEPEQQAEFIETAFRSGYFDPLDPNHGVFKVGGTDLTVYLETALSELRAGNGAP